MNLQFSSSLLWKIVLIWIMSLISWLLSLKLLVELAILAFFSTNWINSPLVENDGVKILIFFNFVCMCDSSTSMILDVQVFVSSPFELCGGVRLMGHGIPRVLLFHFGWSQNLDICPVSGFTWISWFKIYCVCANTYQEFHFLEHQ